MMSPAQGTTEHCVRLDLREAEAGSQVRTQVAWARQQPWVVRGVVRSWTSSEGSISSQMRF